MGNVEQCTSSAELLSRTILVYFRESFEFRGLTPKTGRQREIGGTSKARTSFRGIDQFVRISTDPMADSARLLL